MNRAAMAGVSWVSSVFMTLLFLTLMLLLFGPGPVAAPYPMLVWASTLWAFWAPFGGSVSWDCARLRQVNVLCRHAAPRDGWRYVSFPVSWGLRRSSPCYWCIMDVYACCNAWKLHAPTPPVCKCAKSRPPVRLYWKIRERAHFKTSSSNRPQTPRENFPGIQRCRNCSGGAVKRTRLWTRMYAHGSPRTIPGISISLSRHGDGGVPPPQHYFRKTLRGTDGTGPSNTPPPRRATGSRRSVPSAGMVYLPRMIYAAISSLPWTTNWPPMNSMMRRRLIERPLPVFSSS